MKKQAGYAMLACVLLGACRKKPDPVATTPPEARIFFENVVNGKPLALHTGKYTNAHGDTFSVDIYKYYISNIKLTAANGEEYAVPESYYLVDEAAKASKELLIKDIPAGSYTKISFLIGVDSLRNVSGAQDGALSPTNAMFWDWNTGYIMAKIEGTSPQAVGKTLAMHLGGFSGPNNVLRKVSLSLPEQLVVAEGKSPVIHMTSEIAEWFKSPHMVDFSVFSIVATPDVDAKMIADNYADMFSITAIEQ